MDFKRDTNLRKPYIVGLNAEALRPKFGKLWILAGRESIPAFHPFNFQRLPKQTCPAGMCGHT